ncbi:hypothetical protein V8G54_015515 [Vigna mungo]|uniref:Uncharacterized protein n=1 Tax=Vigna mungo TaxID=3915 RepID=A0AAQ3NJK7_VIGMU
MDVEVRTVLDEGDEGIVDSERRGDDDVSQQLGERTEEDDGEGHGGVTEQLGEAREKHDVEGVCGTQSLGDGGVTQELGKDVGGSQSEGYGLGEGERREVDDGEGERTEVHDGEDERTKVDDGEGGITQELGDLGDLEDMEVEVREYERTTYVEDKGVVGDWSTLDDDDNREVNNMEGLANINVECDFKEGDCSGNMHVQVEFVSLDNERLDLSDISQSDLDDDDISDSSLFNDE